MSYFLAADLTWQQRPLSERSAGFSTGGGKEQKRVGDLRCRRWFAHRGAAGDARAHPEGVPSGAADGGAGDSPGVCAVLAL